jgi:hypothetical protein
MMTPTQRRKLTAVHETVHAMYLISSGIKVNKVSIVANEKERGSVDADFFPVTFDNFLKVCRAIWATAIMESTLVGSANIAGDLAELRRLSLHFSLDQEQFLEVFGFQMDSAAAWLAAHSHRILVIAEMLFKNQTLTGQQVSEAMENLHE